MSFPPGSRCLWLTRFGVGFCSSRLSIGGTVAHSRDRSIVSCGHLLRCIIRYPCWPVSWILNLLSICIDLIFFDVSSRYVLVLYAITSLVCIISSLIRLVCRRYRRCNHCRGYQLRAFGLPIPCRWLLHA